MKFRYFRTGLLPILGGVLAVGGLLLGAQMASAQVCNGTSSDPATCTSRTTGNGLVCLGDLSGYGAGINCTANDVSIGFADNVRDSSGNTISSCFQGSMLTNATADFHVQTSGGVTRYDIGLYFATDGDPNHNGAKSGGCSVSKITPTNNISGNYINLDLLANGGSQATDSCGDINDTHKPQVVRITFSTPCEPSPLFFNPTTGQCQTTAPSPTAAHCVILPNGVSWRQTGANDVCDSPIDAFPGTTAKCNVNPTFGIPVIVEPVDFTVVKTATPTTVKETGGTVHYTVQVISNATIATLTIDSITDNVYGNLGTNTPAQTNNSCPSLIGTTLQPHGSTSCGFDAFESGDFNPGGAGLTDVVVVCGHDNTGHTGLCESDDATVTFEDVPVTPGLDKSALSATFTVDVTYQVVVTNNSSNDTLTVNSLADDKFGDITTAHPAGGGFEQVVTACTLSQNPIPVAQNATCTFVGRITGSNGTTTHVNNLTGAMTDSDNAPYSRSDSATVSVSITFP